MISVCRGVGQTVWQVCNDLATPVTSSESILGATRGGAAMGALMGLAADFAFCGPRLLKTESYGVMPIYALGVCVGLVAAVARQYAIYIRGSTYGQELLNGHDLGNIDGKIRALQIRAGVFGVSAAVLGGGVHLLNSRWILGGLGTASAAVSVACGAYAIHKWFHPPTLRIITGRVLSRLFATVAGRRDIEIMRILCIDLATPVTLSRSNRGAVSCGMVMGGLMGLGVTVVKHELSSPDNMKMEIWPWVMSYFGMIALAVIARERFIYIHELAGIQGVQNNHNAILSNNDKKIRACQIGTAVFGIGAIVLGAKGEPSSLKPFWLGAASALASVACGTLSVWKWLRPESKGIPSA